MLNISKKAFSLVELIVVITILVIIGTIGVSMNDGYKEKTYNTKVVTDLTTIENSLIRYKQENSFIPSPEGNLKYFTSDGSYAHDETEAYGFHGFITEKTIPKKYINVFPRDPRSKQYYAYGKTISGGFFEVSGVFSNRDKFESVVVGNYEGKDPIYNLIREYNGPDFVYDKSKKNFPYNPDEMLLTAKISSFTGNLTLNNTIIDKNIILERQLIPGDNIKLSAGSTAIIYYSDGTVSYLGDNENPLELTLSVMKYKKDDNLFTRIRLALNFGTILTKASKMATESNFDLYTTDTEASVRGTIFEIKRIEGENKTSIKVVKGSIFLNAINISSYEELLDKLQADEEISPKFPITPPIPDYTELVLVLGHQESILKEGGEITIDGNTDTFQPVINPDACNLDEHMEELTGCISNVESCDINDLLGIKIGEGNKVWNITRGDCKAISCIDGYELQGSECIKESICDENQIWDGSNCISIIKEGVICTGLPNNALWNNVNNIIQTWNLDLSKYMPSSAGVYDTLLSDKECRFKCKDTFSRISNNCVCPTGTYEENGVCKTSIITRIVTCGGTIPSYATRTTLTTYIQTLDGSIRTPIKNWLYNETVCGFKCNINYTWNSTTKTCVANTRIVTCGGTIPSYATRTTLTTYTQIWNGSIWTPTKVWLYNETICGFKCNINYTWNATTKTCIANTRIATCGGTFPQYATRITSTTYTQTWNGSIRIPTKNRGYNQSVCGFICNTNYSRIGGICKANTITVSGYGCDSCPSGSLSGPTKIGSCFFGNRYERKCGTQICKKEEDVFDCNDFTNYSWSITIYQ